MKVHTNLDENGHIQGSCSDKYRDLATLHCLTVALHASDLTSDQFEALVKDTDQRLLQQFGIAADD